MKNFFKSLVVGALLLGSVGCSDMFKEEIYDIYNELDNINARIDSLCNAVNTNIASLQTIIDVMQDNDYVDSITPIVEGGETVGYEIVFTQSGSVKIYHGKKGETGHTPIVGVQQAEDGRWYWTIDGEWLLDGEGDKVLAEAIDGIDGEKGEEGITPKLEVRDNYWYISYDNGATWVQLGKATGENGKDGDSMFKSISYNDDYVELVLADGKTVIKIPTWASHMLLVDEIAKINSNISAIQAAIEALESNDYVQKVTPVKDEEGNVIGYTLQFAFTGDVTIFHGEDGKDGEDGEDGKDGADGEDGKDGKDGYTPVIGARQHPDGNWYWTVDTEWLLDTNGNRVKTTGEDGTSGITPELKIEDDYWYVSYDKGQTWTKLGKAKGEDGADGEGKDGDSFFKDVNVTEDYVTFTLANGTEIKIPTWKVYQELADAVAHLNTNVQSLVDIINAIQNNDFVTGTTEIVDPQTNEVIGYKLHFSKSGYIEIYHGKTPNAPKIGIKKHPQYGNCWAYNDQYIYDEAGKPVALPQDGSDAIAPKFKIEGGRWWMSTDGGDSWDDIGQATGDQGQQGETGATGGTGDSFFKNVKSEYATDSEGNVLNDKNGKPIVAYIVLTLSDNSEYRVPTAYITDELTKRIAAIEGKFAAINTIVNALQNAEYIKEIVELYDDSTPPLLVGYEITFVKYTIGTDGKLAETTRKRTIRTGDAGAAGTVVAAEYDEATDTWYWTLDGEPLKDADGNYVAINGKEGKPGVTPQMRINTTTNFWEVSYDNGNTWKSTDVLATGPQGNPGQGGAAGDSLFAGVSKDGDYWVFELEKGEKIKVPTAEAFASLAGRVAALEKSAESILSLVNGKKYIESCEPFSNDSGSGYHLVLVSLNAETGEATQEDCFIYNGIAGNTPVVGLRQDEATGDWYWTVDGDDLLVDGKPVKANGPEPSFHIDQNGHLWVNVNGNEKDLGNVIGAGGGSGADASILVEEVKDDAGKPTGELIITFMSGTSETGKISVPSWAKFVELQNAINDIKSNVTALNSFVNGNSYITNYEPIVKDGKTVGFTADLVQYTIKQNEDGIWETSNPTTTPISFSYECMVTVVNKGTETAPSWEWVVNGQETGIPMDGSDWVPSVVLHTDNNIYISKANGHDANTLAKDLTEEGWEQYWIQIDTSKTTDTFATVTGNENDGYTIKFPNGDKIKVPSYAQYTDLLATVNTLQQNLTAIKDLMNGQSYLTGYKDLKDGDKVVGFTATLVKYTITTDEKGYYVTSGKTETPITFQYDCMVSVADGEWVINGEPTGIPVDGRDWVPTILLHEGMVYVSTNTERTSTLDDLKADITADTVEENWIVINPNDTDTKPGEDNNDFAIVTGSEDEGWQITFPPVGDTEEGQTIHVPSYKKYEELLETVNTLKQNVTAIKDLINSQSYLTDYKEKKDGNKVIGFTANLVKYTITTDEKGNYVTSDAQKTPITFQYDCMVSVADGEWVINGEPTGIPVDGRDWVPTILLHEGMVYVSTNTERTSTLEDLKADIAASKVEENWLVINPNDTDTKPGEDNNDFATVTGSEDKGWQITFPGENGQTIHVPSYAQYTDLFETVNDLSKNVQALNTLMSGNNFITGFKEVTDQLGNIIGFDATVVGYQSTKNEDGTYNYTQTKGGTIEYRYNDVVTLIKKDNVYYWHILNGTSEDGTPSYIDIKVDGTDWVPAIVPYNNYVYISISPEATAQTLEKDLATNGGSDKWIKIYNPEANGYTTVTPIYEDPENKESMIVGYTITFANGESIKTPTFITTPKISFTTSGTINYDTADKDPNNFVKVEFTITGSFIDKPVVLASCEGNWISTEVELGQWAEGQRTITGSVGVKPTTAYVGDSTNGKLTLYVPYYGNTAIAQKALQASGAKEYDGETKSVGAEQTSFSIEIKAHQSLNTENAPFKLSFEPLEEGVSCDWISATTSGTISGQLNGDEMTYTQYLSVRGNFTEKARSCYMHVYSPDGRKIRKVKIEQDAFDFTTVTNLADVDKTGEEDPANCYIISSPGRYMIPLYEGSTGAWKKTSAKLYKNANNQPYVWTDNKANAIEFTELDTAEDFLLFEVDVDEKIADGNTVIAATDENGNIIWSWHLWFCEVEPGLDTYPNSDRTGASDYQLMDRSLGAKSSVITPIGSYKIPWTVYTGLYYQWGRKDPLHKDSPKKDYETYMETIENPEYFYKKWEGEKDGKNLWSGEEKTTNDPCPPGYKVPTNDVWTASNPDVTKVYFGIELGSNSDHYAYNISSTSPPHNISFAYGYLDSEGNEIKKAGEQRERIQGREVTGTTSNRKGKYTSSDYTVFYDLYKAAMWASNDQIALNYEFKERPDNQSIIIHNGIYSENKGSLLRPNWVNSEIKDLTVGGNTVTDAFYEQLTHPYAKDYKGHSPACALQIRCLKM